MQRHRYTVGIDPHKHVHHATIIDERGSEVATRPFSADTSGQAQLIAWAREHGEIDQWAVEGTGGLGRHIAVALLQQGADVGEVPPHATAAGRARGQGKSDRIDAVAIARHAQQRHLRPAFKRAAPAAGPDPLHEQLVLITRARRSLVKVRVQLLT